MTTKNNPSDFDSKYYMDMGKWLNMTGVQGSPNHEHLNHSYRKAAVTLLALDITTTTN